ncbi:MAG: hypothetical protein PHX27_02725 [Candidatus ainarchaeum sp.]|nr:hypothetical protein [Candidatus ainarchaeum sp.]
MSYKNSDIPDLADLSIFEKEIFKFVLEKWPTNTLEIAINFNEDISSKEQKKRISAKYAYYLKKLVDRKLLLSKKAGNSIIVWPIIVEKYRVIHDILKNENYFEVDIFEHFLKSDKNA